MARDASMTIRIDKALKQEAQRVFADLGLDMTTAVTMFLKQAIRCDGLPFPVVRSELPNKETREAMAEVDTMLQTGAFKTYGSVEALFEALDA